MNKDAERSDKMSCLSDKFNEVLSPMEPTIMRLQSLLVWEKPIKSAVLIAAVHGIFWFFLYGGCRFFSTLSTVLMVVFFLYTWKKKIWPEIRVPPKSPDTDEWTPVHPRLLSVPELSQHLALTYCYVEHCVKYWTTLRRDRPLKFCVETSFISACLAVVGHYLSGGTLTYIIIMSSLLWPCLQYHNLLSRFYMRFEPIFMKLDYSIKVKNKWRYEGDKSPISTKENRDEQGKLTRSVCADNESDLEDFYPSPADPMISAALARAITDSEDEGGSPSMPITPRVSKEASVTNSDVETDDGLERTEEEDFGLSLDMMPSYDETLDHTDDELLDLPSLSTEGRTTRESSEESMRFEPGHFEDSDDEVSFAPRSTKASKRGAKARGAMVRGGELDTEAVAREVVSQAFTSVMGNMLKNSMLGTLQNMAASQPDGKTNSGKADTSSRDTRNRKVLGGSESAGAAGDRFACTYSDSEDDDADSDTMATSEHIGRRDELADGLISEDSASLNIEDEFDFLEEYEYGSSAEKK